MGKKRCRTKKISKGQRPSIAKSTVNLVETSVVDSMLNKVEAWLAGKNPWVTISKPTQTKNDNARFIKVRARELWGQPRRHCQIYSKVTAD